MRIGKQVVNKYLLILFVLNKKYLKAVTNTKFFSFIYLLHVLAKNNYLDWNKGLVMNNNKMAITHTHTHTYIYIYIYIYICERERETKLRVCK